MTPFKPYFYAIFILSIFVNCQKENSPPTDRLLNYNIIGQWKISATEINGVSNMAMECCRAITLKIDSNTTDLKGTFEFKEEEIINSGSFQLLNNSTIQFQFPNTTISRTFYVSGDQLELTYFENGDKISEFWRKE